MRLGSDPEIFLQGRKDGQFKSIIGKIKADKWNPRQIEGMPQGFTLQEDNVALEFGVPPAASRDEFVRNIRGVLLAGLKHLPGEKFSKLSCTIFPKEEMEHPSAHVFGCEPDFNAWTKQENGKPQPPHPFMRSAGGHVHIETKLNRYNVIRACDLFLGVPSVLMDNGTERRALYGKAGAFRPKSYGAEYRTLSNFWIFKPKLIEWVWDNAERAVNLAAKFEEAKKLIEDKDGIQQCINTGDKALAEQLCKKFDLEVV
jgi:hypothetical protein